MSVEDFERALALATEDLRRVEFKHALVSMVADLKKAEEAFLALSHTLSVGQPDIGPYWTDG